LKSCQFQAFACGFLTVNVIIDTAFSTFRKKDHFFKSPNCSIFSLFISALFFLNNANLFFVSADRASSDCLNKG